jgi:hypothetical protein
MPLKKQSLSRRTAVADAKFSVWIRERDKCCVVCGSRQNLQCSHYWSRGISLTRFDPENADTLCAKCHWAWEERKQGEYRDFKLKQLGKRKYDQLTKRSLTIYPRQKAVDDFYSWYH